jgi:predicted house-cleaning NTP pyrophosphatase (Maf/HAM1 superfamily)
MCFPQTCRVLNSPEEKGTARWLQTHAQPNQANEAVTTTVKWRRDITDADLWAYARTRDGVEKAGGYAIQGFAGCFIEEIDGSHSNVAGLPLEFICETLKKAFGMPIWTIDRTCGWRSSNPIIQLPTELKI